MKILCAEYNDAGDVAIVPVGDDVLLRNNGDFYIPEFTRSVSCVPQLVVRICKLGKSVSERFASRYYEEIGVGVRFYADSYEEELQGKGLPAVMASSFDSCAAISALLPVEAGTPRQYAMRVNDTPVFCGEEGDLPVSINRLVALASDFHTLKIGDYLYCGNTLRFRELNPDDRIRVSLQGKELLDFRIK